MNLTVTFLSKKSNAMKVTKIKTFYRNSLPHIQPIGATFFVTFRLKDSIPRNKLWELKQAYEEKINEIRLANELSDIDGLIYDERKRFFGKYDQLLDKCNTGPTHLKNPKVAQIVANELHRFDGDLYELIAYSILSNHVHILIDTAIQIPDNFDYTLWECFNFEPLQNIMKRIKGSSAVYANRLLKRSGKFWQRESYDHYTRNDKELCNIVEYILHNPVKAKLIEKWEEHPFTYLADFS